MLICAAAAARAGFRSFGWLWSPHDSELQWEVLVMVEISI